MSVFDELDERVLLAAKEFSLREPTKPQELAIPKILEGKHVLLIAPTGTGKTEAALLPIFSMCLSQQQPPGIKILYIAPLRALNRDMLTRLTRWAEILGLSIAVRHGDTAVREREMQARRPPDMLITTPETLQAIIPGKRMKEHLKTVRWVIVDEVHELAEDKRGVQLSIGLERLVELAGEFQRVGLSATIGSPRKVAKFLAGSSRDVEIVDASGIKEMRILVECPTPTKSDIELSERLFTGPAMAARLRHLRELMDKHGSTLIFVNTREMAEILGSRLKLLDPSFSVEVHHGSLSKEVRIEA
ncbi:MAG: DEAD/DEAH box helicase, partial [Hadesarchaea archaeon]|nr:DEAD/DEAH box helicase [Hadesarchaea archaeon]